MNSRTTLLGVCALIIATVSFIAGVQTSRTEVPDPIVLTRSPTAKFKPAASLSEPIRVPIPPSGDIRYQVTAKDEEVYRKLKAVGCGIECDAEHPPDKYHCGADEIAWEHAVLPADVVLNCLYEGKTAEQCHEDCR